MTQRIAVELFLMLLVGIILALTGPFDTFELPLAERLILWPLMILAGYPVFKGFSMVSRWLAELTHIPLVIAAMLTLMVASLPMALIVLLLWFRKPFGAALMSPMLWPLYFQVLVIAVIIHGAMHLLMRTRAVADDSAPHPPTASQPLAPATPETPGHALPLPSGFGEIRALKGEDHYVRVIGDRSETLILMRMRDAIERLGGVSGLRVHRSWWVAEGAAASVRRDGRTAVITLAGGHEIPVARDMMPALRAGGWL